MPRKPVNVRKSRVVSRGVRKPAPKNPYTKKAVDDAYREVQTKMRKEVTKLQKIKSPLNNLSFGTGTADQKSFKGKDSLTTARNQFNTGIKRMQDIGMKGRAARTKAISAASKKHGVPKSQITAKKPINPGEVASKMARQMKAENRF